MADRFNIQTSSDYASILNSIINSGQNEIESIVKYLSGYTFQSVPKEKTIGNIKKITYENAWVKTQDPLLNEKGITFIRTFLQNVWSSSSTKFMVLPNEDAAKNLIRHSGIELLTDLANNLLVYEIKDYDVVADLLTQYLLVTMYRIIKTSTDKELIGKIYSEQTSTEIQPAQYQIPQTQKKGFWRSILPF